MTGRMVGVEVLARWNHPEQGLLAPAAFVPMAEELGLIRVIDEAVFEAACAAHRALGGRRPDRGRVLQRLARATCWTPASRAS